MKIGNRPANLSRPQAQAAGAFYTGSDITAYIAQATILPFLLDSVGQRCPQTFQAAGPVSRLLQSDPDRYIHQAVRHGLDRTLRGTVGSGPLPSSLGLPTETWPELAARRQRCQELRNLMSQGKVATSDDLVSYNLDTRRLVLDLIASADAKLVTAIEDCIATIRILDPTCGDGAFLLAALEILEEVASACAERRTGTTSDGIRRALISRNLHGIDLMPAAVGLCRANLLRKLAEVGQNGRAPGLGRNIRQGNVLTEGGALLGAEAFDIIVGNPPYVPTGRAGYAVAGYQTAGCPDVYAWVLERSARLLRPGGRLGMIVPLSLGFSGGFAPCRKLLFEAFAPCWFASFGRIPSALFDFDIRVRNTIFLGKQADGGRETPESPGGSRRDSADNLLGGLTPPARPCYATRLHRWFNAARPNLFALLDYAPVRPECWNGKVPKPNTARLAQALERLREASAVRLGDCLARQPTAHVLYFKKTAYNWLTFCPDLPPCLDAKDRPIPQTQFDALYFPERRLRDAAFLFLNGKWAYAYWSIVGDDFHVARWMFADFPIDLSGALARNRRKLLALAPRLESALHRAVRFKRNAGKRVGTYNLARCRLVTDRSDRLFTSYLGLEDVWDDVELLYAQTVKTDFSDV